jgi:hypothetical protein
VSAAGRPLIATLAAASIAIACGRSEASRPAGPVVVRNPDYLVVRTIRREADAEHVEPVELSMAGGGFGFVSTTPLLDLNAFDLAAAEFAGGRTSVVGEAAIWLPLKPEARRRMEEWSSAHPGDYLGIYRNGRLVSAPKIQGTIGAGIPLRVSSKSEGDIVLGELRNGGAPRAAAP